MSHPIVEAITAAEHLIRRTNDAMDRLAELPASHERDLMLVTLDEILSEGGMVLRYARMAASDRPLTTTRIQRSPAAPIPGGDDDDCYRD